MKAFIEREVPKAINELSDEGLKNQLMAVAVTLSPGALPSAANKGLTGKTFRRVVNAIPNISTTDVEILADWLGEEYPDALPKFIAHAPLRRSIAPAAGGTPTRALVPKKICQVRPGNRRWSRGGCLGGRRRRLRCQRRAASARPPTRRRRPAAPTRAACAFPRCRFVCGTSKGIGHIPATHQCRGRSGWRTHTVCVAHQPSAAALGEPAASVRQTTSGREQDGGRSTTTEPRGYASSIQVNVFDIHVRAYARGMLDMRESIFLTSMSGPMLGACLT